MFNGFMSERDFQNFVKANWSGVTVQLHPGMGSDVGISDLLLGYSIGLLPCELKLGVINDGLLCVSAVRPAQIAWHRKLAIAGHETIFMVGVPNGKNLWRVFVIDGLTIQGWDSNGFIIGKQAIEINAKDLSSGVEDFLIKLS